MKTKLHLLLLIVFLINIQLNSQTTLSAGDIVVVAINGDADVTNSYGRGFSFMPLVNLEAGTVINFTDYGWSDVTGAFITNTSVADAFIHYTAPSSITAGTIIRCDSYANGNFTYDFSYSGSGNNYLNTAGLTQGDEVLVFQGARATPTFICAASIVNTSLVASGWATSVGTNGTDNSGAGSALPGSGNASVVDLVDDVTALSFNQASSANDNCAYSGATTATTTAVWKTRISAYSNWTFNDIAPIPTPLVGPFTITDALPVELTSFSAAIINSIVLLNWQTATEVNNYGFNVECRMENGEWTKIGFVQGNGNSNSPKEYSYLDKPNHGSVFKYRLKQIDTDGKYEYSPEVEVTLNVTTNFSVKQNFPNPFNPTTKIEFSIPSNNNVKIKVFNVLGVEVATLLNEHRQAGTYSIEFNASNLSSGIYFYEIVSGNYSDIKKMILLR